ncbi:response regulator transcription factor [Egibacter rhizosphaerae]|uniref:Response regulator transcription factor n=2 Tax=Egibacter rhizosphaerae TaxID=1670831 RepID=A0A411YLC4_9ACTN|nr:response regulator transcription factor [Egibacter rhizosphaerae]
MLPALDFLDHELATGDLAAAAAEAQTDVDLVLVDATRDLAGASTTCRELAARDLEIPVLVVVSDGGLAALKASWGFNDWLLPSAQPAEVETRMRLAVDRHQREAPARAANVGDLQIDEETYIVRLRGRPLDLTFREFELLKFLANHPGRVYTRSQLLQEVWGYDYFGGTRTVDVHIRRLRAKLGAEYEQLIGTVRGVGYKLDPQGAAAGGRPDEHGQQGDGSESR